MIFFIIGTLLLLAFLAWATYRSAIALREMMPDFNMLLHPVENAMRLVLVGVCVALGVASGLSITQLGWTSADVARDTFLGLGVGVLGVIVLQPITHWAVARFGRQIYSPVIILNILPRTRREWVLVPLALVSAVFLEELLFRSLLVGGFSVFCSPALLAIVWSSLFGAMHLPQGNLGMIVAAALGVVLSILFLATSSLVAPFIAHYVINVLQVFIATRDKTLLENYGTATSSNL
jgi:membrane protease YdiL (CAAX protease family)